MTSLSRLTLILLAIAALAIPTTLASRPTPTPSSANPRPIRIGTYDTRALALVWARSAKFTDTLTKLSAEANEAQAAGNTKRFDEIHNQMTRLQFTTHVQVFSTAAPEEALTILQPDLPEIARQADVTAIVAHLDYQSPGIETIDLTETLLARFNPTPEILKMAHDLRKTKPTTLYDAAHAD